MNKSYIEGVNGTKGNQNKDINNIWTKNEIKTVKMQIWILHILLFIDKMIKFTQKDMIPKDYQNFYA